MKHKTGSLVLASCVALLALPGPAIPAAPPETPPAGRAPAMNPDQTRQSAERLINNFDSEVDAALKKMQRLIKEELNKRDREARLARVNADMALGQAKSAIAAAKKCDSDYFRRHSEWARERIQSAREHRENVDRITRDLDKQAHQTMKEVEESAKRTSALIRSGFTDLRALGLSKNSREWTLLQKAFENWVDKQAIQEGRGTPKNNFNDPGGLFKLKEAHSHLYSFLRKDEQFHAVYLPQEEEAIEKAIKEGESLLKKNCPPKVAGPKTRVEVINDTIYFFATNEGEPYECSVSFTWSAYVSGARRPYRYNLPVLVFKRGDITLGSYPLGGTVYTQRSPLLLTPSGEIKTFADAKIDDVPAIACKVIPPAFKYDPPKLQLPGYTPPQELPDPRSDPKPRK